MRFTSRSAFAMLCAVAAAISSCVAPPLDHDTEPVTVLAIALAIAVAAVLFAWDNAKPKSVESLVQSLDLDQHGSSTACTRAAAHQESSTDADTSTQQTRPRY